MASPLLSIHLKFEALREVAHAHNLEPSWLHADKKASTLQFLREKVGELLDPDVPDVPGCITWEDHSRMTEMMHRVKRDLSDAGKLDPKERNVLKEAVAEYFQETDKLQKGLARLIRDHKNASLFTSSPSSSSISSSISGGKLHKKH